MAKQQNNAESKHAPKRQQFSRHAEAVSASRIILADNKGRLTDGRDDKDKGPKRGKSVGT